MSQDILITPGSGEPQILFRGSGTTDTAVELNVLSSYQSATGSGTALLFEGEEGLLFGITDNLSSGTIFSVSDISGLTAIEYDASGDLKLGEYANSTTLYADRGVYLATGIPTNTTNAVYISGGALHFNGSALGGGSSYNDAPISGYFESRVDQADSDIATVSGLLYDDAAISGYFESRVEQNAADIVTVSGLAGGSSYTAGSGLTLVGTEFNVYGGSGNFQQIDVTSDNTFTPKMVFTGSGVTDTPIRMKVLSSHASASTSGTALAFEGTEGQLFGITDNLSSGTIFSVNDITGLPAISYDASGDLKIGEFASSATLYTSRGVYLSSGIPAITTSAIYDSGGALHYNGAAVGGGSNYTAGSGLTLVGTEFNTAGTGNFEKILFNNTDAIKIGLYSQAPATGIAIGYQAGSGATDIGDNVIIGQGAAAEAFTIHDAVAIGWQAAYDAHSDGTVAIGREAGKFAYMQDGVAIGNRAGMRSAWSTDNDLYKICIGADAGYLSNNADYAVHLGYQAGYNSDSQWGVAIGYRALKEANGARNLEILCNSTSPSTSVIGTSNTDKLHIATVVIGDHSAKKLAIGDVGSADLTPDATLEIKPKVATDVGLIVQAVTSHTASLQEWQNSSETKLLAVGPDGGLELPSNTPSTTTNKLYNDGSKLNFDGATLPKSDPVAGASGIHNMMVMSQATYDALGTKDPNTLYYIV
jgi:hypothetical protein